MIYASADLAAHYGRAADAAAELLWKAFRVDVAKALNPLNRRDFNVIVNRVASGLSTATRGMESRTVDTIIRGLDVDWPNLSAAQRERIIEAARLGIRSIGTRAAPRVEAVLTPEAQAIVRGTKDAVVDRYNLGISTNLSATDRRIAAHASSSQTNFVRDEYGRRADAFGQQARDTVASGLDRGIGRDDIAEELELALQGQVTKSPGYWRVLASAFTGRARSWTQVSSFDDAGIQRYRVEAVLDEATSEICRFMHGQSFEVKKAAERLQVVAGLEDPEEIRTAQPWGAVGYDDDGNPYLYYNDADGERQEIAGVEEFGEGEKDRRGTYSDELDEDALSSAGFELPPYHGNCRTTVVAEV